MAKTSDWVIGTLIIVSLLIFIFMVFSFFMGVPTSDGLSFSGERVGVIEIEGLIYDSEHTVNLLKKYGSHKSIKAILLHIDSPGGVVAPTQEIYYEVKRLRSEGIPVIASIGSICASGGYYIASACDTIVSNPGSITGSIGVIMEFTEVHELLDKLGIEFNIIKSGKYKDTGSPFRKLTDEERELFQGVVNDTYEQFVEVVSENRNLDIEEVKKLADGRIFSGRQAYNYKLVDVLGSYEEALKIARNMGGLPEDAKIVKEKRKKITILDLIFGDVIDNFNMLIRKNHYKLMFD